MALAPLLSSTIVACCLFTAAMPRICAAQHITVDGRFSPAYTLQGPNYAIDASLGKQVGSNLFHSFGQFGLTTSESATFRGPATISNVIGRVTSGNPSSIDGSIKSAITGANLYLINPSGIVFGPNATVNVSGSFHASTAYYLKMSDGAKFRATNPDASTLSTAPPAAFGFLTPRPAAITVNRSSLGPVPGTLGLVGGPVSITGAALSAPGGTIHVTSAARAGEVPVDPHNTSARTVTGFGRVAIRGGSTISAGDQTTADLGSGGSVFVRAGSLTVDNSAILANNFGSGSGGLISLRGKNRVTLRNGTLVQADARPGSTGSGGSIAVHSRTLTVDNSIIKANTLGSGPGGSISLHAKDRIAFSNGAEVVASTAGSGNGGALTISTAPSGSISADNAIVTTESFGSGSAGRLTAKTGELTITNQAELLNYVSGSGAGGPITVTAGSVLADSGANLGLTAGIFSFSAGTGNGGSIFVDTKQLILRDQGSVFSANVSSSAPVQAGAVTVSVHGPIIIELGGQIGTKTEGIGDAGNVSVTASGLITIDMSTMLDMTELAGIGSLTKSVGNAGEVRVYASALKITHNGEISSHIAMGSSGNSAGVFVSVSGDLTIDGTGADPNFLTGISSQSNPGSISFGNQGSVKVKAADLYILNNGEISGVAPMGRVTQAVRL